MNLWANLPRLSGRENLWDQLAEAMGEPVSLEAGRGVWNAIILPPGGLWQELRDETLILTRPGNDLWEKTAQEDVITDGTSIWTMALPEPRLVSPRDATEDSSGYVWKKVEEETLVLPRVKVSVWELPKVRDLANYRPQRAPGWALKKLQTSAGETYYVLKNTRQNSYMRLTEQQSVLWNMLDGSHTVQDLAVASFMKFGSFNVDGLAAYLTQLKQNGFLMDATQDVYQAAKSDTERRTLWFQVKRIARLIFQSELNLPVDGFFGAVYKMGGWVLYTKPAQILIPLITLIGLPAYFLIASSGSVGLLGGAETAVGIGLLGLIANQVVTFFIHESAHALTTKHYGRYLKRGGVGLYFGMIAYFIDTTDIWMEPRKPRLAVTWAGPYSGFFLGSAASLIILAAPQFAGTPFLYQFATFCYTISAFNLMPLIKLDGYYLLMDWLEMPMLRERSIDFVRNKLWAKLRRVEKFSRDELIFSVYGVLALIWSVVMVYLFAKFWGGQIISFFQKILLPLFNLG